MAKEHVHGVFESIAGGYDAANDRISLGMHRMWKRRLEEAAVAAYARRAGQAEDEGQAGRTGGASGVGRAAGGSEAGRTAGTGNTAGEGGAGRTGNAGDAAGASSAAGEGGAERTAGEGLEPGLVLDVCCGTGDITEQIARAHPDVLVVGLDFSAGMLEVARERVAGLDNVLLVEGDAMDLPFDAATFDAAVVSFGLRNTPDYEQVLRQMARVTRPGGTVACLDASVPDAAFVRPFYRFYYKHIMTLLGGGLRHHGEYEWLYESTQEFLTKVELAALFGRVGLAHVAVRPFMCGAAALHTGVVPGADDAMPGADGAAPAGEGEACGSAAGKGGPRVPAAGGGAPNTPAAGGAPDGGGAPDAAASGAVAAAHGAPDAR